MLCHKEDLILRPISTKKEWSFVYKFTCWNWVHFILPDFPLSIYWIENVQLLKTEISATNIHCYSEPVLVAKENCVVNYGNIYADVY